MMWALTPSAFLPHAASHLVSTRSQPVPCRRSRVSAVRICSNKRQVTLAFDQAESSQVQHWTYAHLVFSYPIEQRQYGNQIEIGGGTWPEGSQGNTVSPSLPTPSLLCVLLSCPPLVSFLSQQFNLIISVPLHPVSSHLPSLAACITHAASSSHPCILYLSQCTLFPNALHTYQSSTRRSYLSL